ncbi:hypothetical protein [Aquipuribacter nitratireducens]|uniref:Uncharacterized protein n=1 Tax=Aquipuribacter nitratireducens TaxID=650104 RepID=A0ABW0GIF8_9MICO
MSVAGLLLGASPSPAPDGAPPPELVTPGTIGFVVTFLVAVAFVFLVRDMVRRVRGIDVRAAREEREAQASDGGSGTEGPHGRPGERGTGRDDADGTGGVPGPRR